MIHERDNEHPNLLKLLVMIIGFLLIGVLRLFSDEHDHSGIEGGHHHAHQTVENLLRQVNNHQH